MFHNCYFYRAISPSNGVHLKKPVGSHISGAAEKGEGDIESVHSDHESVSTENERYIMKIIPYKIG